MVEKSWISKEDIVSQVMIMDIAKEFNVHLIPVSSTNYKCCCPSKEHKNGQERTPSCMINIQDNKFYCFGCNQGVNSIDFYMLCSGLSFGDAVKILRERVVPGKISQPVVEVNNFYLILKTSNLLRETLKNHPEDQEWIEEITENIDKEILDLESTQEKEAKKIYKRVSSLIKERYYL